MLINIDTHLFKNFFLFQFRFLHKTMCQTRFNKKKCASKKSPIHCPYYDFTRFTLFFFLGDRDTYAKVIKKFQLFLKYSDNVLYVHCIQIHNLFLHWFLGDRHAYAKLFRVYTNLFQNWEYCVYTKSFWTCLTFL